MIALQECIDTLNQERQPTFDSIYEERNEERKELKEKRLGRVEEIRGYMREAREKLFRGDHILYERCCVRLNTIELLVKIDLYAPETFNELFGTSGDYTATVTKWKEEFKRERRGA